MKKINENTKITLTIRQLKRLIRESIISEDKTKLINRLELPDIDDEYEKEDYKQELIRFFKTHSNYENKIDWNKVETLTKSDFDKVIDSAKTSKSSIKNIERAEIALDLKKIFKSDDEKKFRVVGENEYWLFVAPLNYKAAVYCDSAINQGAGAKWCIGDKDDHNYWNRYIIFGSAFVMAFNKDYKNLSDEERLTNLKYMIQLDDQMRFHIWNQIDHDTGRDVERFGISKEEAKQMFSGLGKEALELLKKEALERSYDEQ